MTSHSKIENDYSVSHISGESSDSRSIRALVALNAIVQTETEVSLLLQIRLRAAADRLMDCEKLQSSRTAIGLTCSMFFALVLHAIPPCIEPGPASSAALHRIQQRSRRYVRLASESTANVARVCGAQLSLLMQRGPPSCERFILTAGCSAHVNALLHRVAASRMHFTLIVLEASPSGEGHATASFALEMGVPVRMMEPSAAARAMSYVALVLCGGHAVDSSGGVYAPIGTLTTAIVAQEHSTPFCVVAPHYCFRLGESTPLDLCDATEREELHSLGVRHDHTKIDHTPSTYIHTYFTDLGALSPAAVADFLFSLDHSLLCET
mmetsp:Transcript_70927/g.117846  ORF Transcript_70927/g.117846 Transcript_70927/m.117846 type:complete len:323 (+) Transcript_70927:3-971(+)|eukprot:CAMPEP_0119318794 /NCGR_PEP_ID=MMETSP1333-20130426/47654_1 /TAXON_ID=418940 /ORGANISM="Scyphosphaera apsteinii, Strain RCC1455" /LENGTH=322 /DNA_ID=CAMNT_0007325077 /DNA_START=1 /DNA_END=969 /DNA_ORIENTATION=+